MDVSEIWRYKIEIDLQRRNYPIYGNYEKCWIYHFDQYIYCRTIIIVSTFEINRCQIQN